MSIQLDLTPKQISAAVRAVNVRILDEETKGAADGIAYPELQHAESALRIEAGDANDYRVSVRVRPIAAACILEACEVALDRGDTPDDDDALVEAIVSIQHALGDDAAACTYPHGEGSRLRDTLREEWADGLESDLLDCPIESEVGQAVLALFARCESALSLMADIKTLDPAAVASFRDAAKRQARVFYFG